ncbi:MAG: hypothetical protein ACE5GX_11980 [Thermoanaerobaculia bacterium]
MTAGVIVISVIALGAAIWWHPKADEFLGPADFSGQPIPPPASSSSVGQTTFNGVLTFTNVDRTMVAKLLPPGYSLAKNLSFWLKTKHPVALLFGDQTDGRQFVAGQPVPVLPADRVHYSETILAIPFVQKTNDVGWHTYIVRMYLDNQIAVNGGALYGYKKKFTCLDWTGKKVEIWRQSAVCPPTYLGSKQELLTGDFRFTGVWLDGSAAMSQLANFDDMFAIWTTRILGRTAIGTSVCSYFEWDLANARVSRAKTSYELPTPPTSKMTAWPGLGDLDSVKLGAVAVRGLRWRLALPFSC